LSGIGPTLDKTSQSTWLHRWIYYLAAALLFAAASLRAFLIFQPTGYVGRVFLVLGAWLALFVANAAFSHRRPWLTPILLLLEMGLVLYSLVAGRQDFFAILFTIIGMQSMHRYSPRVVGGLIGVFALLIFFSLLGAKGLLQALALSLSYTGVGIFLSTYIWYTRQAEAGQKQQQVLLANLEKANQELEFQARQQEQLTAVHERQRLARDLHDSVTQTIFSMTLTTQSALLLLQKDRAQVPAQLDRLDQLAQGAMGEMQKLISQLAPPLSLSGFVESLKQHFREREMVDGLQVELKTEGSKPLLPAEEAGLFRIAQEALNNIVKHAGVSQAAICLHLAEPFWMEIADLGVGFDPSLAGGDRKMGLAGMGERAAEIGWTLQVESSPGQGTRIRVAKLPAGKG
jgi:signal transduction histidine kinase